MEAWSSIVALAGVLLTLLVLVDVFLTVLHLDTDGPIGRATFHLLWRTVVWTGRLQPAARRSLVAFAGPTMIAATFVAWIGLFILGFTLLYWPYLDLFRAVEGHQPLGFTDALYFSGVTATVLGYGDLTPTATPLKIVSVLQSGLGFALFTGIVTYLLSVVSGVSERNAVALRLWTETGRTGDGTVAVIRSLRHEEVADLGLRLRTLLRAMESLQQKMHQFPILDLFYRARSPALAPELLVQSASQVAIAAGVVAGDRAYRRLLPVSQELADVVAELMKSISSQHFGSEVRERIDHPTPGAEDERSLQRVRAALSQAAPGLDLEGEPEREPLDLIFRLRTFLDAADALTHWRLDHRQAEEPTPTARR